ncbi:DUF2931 family protein [Pseudomonas fluorescens]|uniref:DUF2931 family protein n=1 Tax=Pseudomonas fluorescens TaxID=294 RepID=UPI001240F1C8|nr:DUF2931 family protein [Pseudomonas fluorescens]VVO95338.1 hypothetical protein PS898_02531 [Pseudomonas fluorescens]
MLEKYGVFLCTLSLALFLSSCTSAADRSLPYDAWTLQLFSPDYMDVVIEATAAIDIDNRLFSNIGSSVAAQSYPNAFRKGTPDEFKGSPAGWPEDPGGKGRPTSGANLPERIYVRWQSLVEPQTYEVVIRIPESTRMQMRKREDIFCAFDGKVITQYRKWLVVGLAPGGIAKVWVRGPCLPGIEITRVKGIVHSKGSNSRRGGSEYSGLHEESKSYIEKFGIPYGSW